VEVVQKVAVVELVVTEHQDLALFL